MGRDILWPGLDGHGVEGGRGGAFVLGIGCTPPPQCALEPGPGGDRAGSFAVRGREFQSANKVPSALVNGLWNRERQGVTQCLRVTLGTHWRREKTTTRSYYYCNCIIMMVTETRDQRFCPGFRLLR